ncbi:MAG: methyltransferase domain-containing protein, partial [Hyphomonas sp.]|nr:methyltransferase domain-containing protein [Hyphomonas sp.]
MRREMTNRIRYVLEDIVPPALRDSGLFRAAASMAWGNHVADLARFRERAAFLTDEEYEALYRKHPRVHEDTDNSDACIAAITADITGASAMDVGCGTGALLRRVRAARTDLGALVGVDFVIDPALKDEGIQYFAAKVEALPFPDNSFDTVICTHVIEHIVDYRAAIAELRRVARQRLILVVPREREYRYTFNPH